MSPRASVVIPGHNEGGNLVDTVACVVDNAAVPALEVIVVDDASGDGSGLEVARRFPSVRVIRACGVGVGAARNLGASRAGGDILVFLDGHCYTPQGWLADLIEPLEDPEVGMTGPLVGGLSKQEGIGAGATWTGPSLDIQWLQPMASAPYQVPLMPGACQALRRDLFHRLGGFDPGMTRWGSEDLELALRVWLQGYQVLVHPEVTIHHLFRSRHPYQVDAGRVLYNVLRMALLHLKPPRVQRVLDHYRDVPWFAESMFYLLDSDAMERRRRLEGERQRDDDWFCERFGCAI